MRKHFNTVQLYTMPFTSLIFAKPTLVLLHAEASTNAIQYFEKLSLQKPFVTNVLYSRFQKTTISLRNPFKLSEYISNIHMPVKLSMTFNDISVIDITPFINRLLAKFKAKKCFEELLSLIKSIPQSVDAPENTTVILWIIKDKNKALNSKFDSLMYYYLYGLKRYKTPLCPNVVVGYINEDIVQNYLIYREAYSDKISISRTISLVSKIYTENEIDTNEFIEVEEPADTTQTAAIVTDKTKPLSQIIIEKIPTKDDIEKIKLKKKQEDVVKYEKLSDYIDVIIPAKTRTKIKNLLDQFEKTFPDKFNEYKSNPEHLVKFVLAYHKYGSIEAAEHKYELIDIEQENIDDILQFDVAQYYQNLPKVSIDGIINETCLPSIDYTGLSAIQKRLYDFENFPSLVVNAIKMAFENSSLKVEEISTKFIDTSKNDIKPSKYIDYNVKIVDVETNDTYTTTIRIPALNKYGFSELSGRKGFLSYVLMSSPIFTVPPNEARIRTMFATISIERQASGFFVYVSGYKIPLIVLLSAFFDINKVFMKYFKLDLRQFDKLSTLEEYLDEADELTQTEKDYIKLLFKPLRSFIKKSLTKASDKDIYSILFDRIQLMKILTEQTDTLIEYKVGTVLHNILDKITAEIIKIQGFSTDIDQLLLQVGDLIMHKKVIDRFDLKFSRLRQYDIIAEFIYKITFQAVAQYKLQKLINPTNAKFASHIPVIDSLRENGVLQIAEEVNPIEQIASLFKTRLVGPGAMHTDRALSVSDRSLHGTQKGIFDPADTSESNPGAFLRLSMSAGVFDKLGRPVRLGNNILSITASTVPFVESTDPIRVLMASNHARQAVGLKHSEKPYIMTGYETLISKISTDSFIKYSEIDGIVEYVDNKKIIIKTALNERFEVDLSPKTLESGSGLKGVAIFEPVVNVGDAVSKQQILAKSQFIDKDGCLTMGVNALVAFFDYDGFTYEDAIVISESFANKSSSIHIQEFEIYLTKTDYVEYLPIEPIIKKGNVVYHVESGYFEIIEAEQLNKVFAETDLKLITADIYLQPDITLDKEEFIEIQKFIDRMKSFDDVVVNVHQGSTKWNSDIEFDIYIKLKCLILEKITAEGDKFSNRHGNKGVVSLILNDDMMPKAKDPITGDFETIDVILSRMGIVSRMNISQLKELAAATCMHDLTMKCRLLCKDGLIDDARKLVIETYEIIDKKLTAPIVDKIKFLSNEEFKKYIENDVLKLIVPPFSRIKPENILNALKHIGSTTTREVYIPKYNIYTTATVGYMYMYKLEHIASVKFNARSMGQYTKITHEPLQGKKRDGGQRISELETWGYYAFDENGKTVLMDVGLVSGDDHIAKTKVVKEIIENGEAQMPETLMPHTRIALANYFVGMHIECPNLSDIYTMKKWREER